MPFSSVLGASSVIKPGVCTSTTRPTVPYTGQLIFETDTSRLAVWTGSAWQYETAAAGPPGLVHITGASFTTATSVSLPDNTFSSTYRNYRMIWQITAATTSVTLTGRYRASGSDNTTSRYFQMSAGYDAGGAASDQADSLTSSITLGGASTFASWFLSVDVFAPNISNIYKGMQGSLQFYPGSGSYRGRAFAAALDTLGAAFQVDSFTLISNTASSISGNYRVYGYADS